jgi:hypothetical protein
MRILLSLIILLSVPNLWLCGQSVDKFGYKNELSLGLGLHTRGFNIATIYTLNQTSSKAFTALLEFSELKSPKERRLTTEALTLGGNSNRSFIYGKQNSLYTLRLGAGQRHYITEKPNKSVVALSFVYSGGLSFGMLKPYYLDLIYRFDPDGYSIRSERYTETNQYKFLEPLDINGATGFGAGWDELSLAPGLYGKAGIIFDWGPNDDISKILEIGLCLDSYFRTIPLMVENVKAPFFFNLYMNVYFGKRWN